MRKRIKKGKNGKIIQKGRKKNQKQKQLNVTSFNCFHALQTLAMPSVNIASTHSNIPNMCARVCVEYFQSNSFYTKFSYPCILSLVVVVVLNWLQFVPVSCSFIFFFSLCSSFFFFFGICFQHLQSFERIYV